MARQFSRNINESSGSILGAKKYFLIRYVGQSFIKKVALATTRLPPMENTGSLRIKRKFYQSFFLECSVSSWDSHVILFEVVYDMKKWEHTSRILTCTPILMQQHNETSWNKGKIVPVAKWIEKADALYFVVRDNLAFLRKDTRRDEGLFCK